VDVVRRVRTTGGVANPQDRSQVEEETVQMLAGTTALQIVNIQGITSVVPMHALPVESLIIGATLEVAGTTVHLGWK